VEEDVVGAGVVVEDVVGAGVVEEDVVGAGVVEEDVVGAYVVDEEDVVGAGVLEEDVVGAGVVVEEDVVGMGVVVVEVVVTVAGQVQLSMSPCGCVILYPSGHVTLRRRHSYLAPSTGPGTLAPSRLNKIGSTPSAVVSALVFKPGQPTGLHWGAFGNEHVLSRTSTDQDTQQPRTRT